MRAWASAWVVLTLLASASAHAQIAPEPPARALTGVLKRIKETGSVRIGYRAQALPFSFEGPGRSPYGYSIDLCAEIVDEISLEVGATRLRTEYVRVTPQDRIEQVAAGRIDLECGSTTNTAERRARVAFSPVTFIAGTRLLVRRGGPVRSLRDLDGRRVVVVRGTTNERVMRTISMDGRRFTVATAEDYAGAIGQVDTDRADALAADDILMYGYLAENALQSRFAVVGELLSHEPYGIAFARDDQAFAAVVQAAFVRLAASRELRWIYNRWFLGVWPSGIRLGLPLSVELERSFQLLGMPVD